MVFTHGRSAEGLSHAIVDVSPLPLCRLAVNDLKLKVNTCICCTQLCIHTRVSGHRKGNSARDSAARCQNKLVEHISDRFLSNRQQETFCPGPVPATLINTVAAAAVSSVSLPLCLLQATNLSLPQSSVCYELLRIAVPVGTIVLQRACVLLCGGGTPFACSWLQK